MTGRRDFSSFLCCAYLAALLLMVNSPQGHGLVNCRKYIYAPVCRGIAAKRSGSFHPAPRSVESNLRLPQFQDYLLERRRLTF
ncbi:hypothetical protein GE061_007340 [Apolygus lucorum]|uniref:Uncharacterized protein n=1 Tax=Apolygus lucorum TaxID=248454 RepID=A0A6A4J2V7_APOLU|nr:hypothetical protein GE061_007340 [Apolygus lucorum]